MGRLWPQCMYLFSILHIGVEQFHIKVFTIYQRIIEDMPNAGDFFVSVVRVVRNRQKSSESLEIIRFVRNR